ncbi:hypothetical protein SAM19_05343 [Brevibacillus laterosporus]|nr:hypothetical protein [Brevibacillus laterosporus]
MMQSIFFRDNAEKAWMILASDPYCEEGDMTSICTLWIKSKREAY